MNLTIDIPDELGTALHAEAIAQGISPDRYVSSVLARSLIARAGGEGNAGPGLRKSRNNKYSLAELMKQCDLSAESSDEDREWLDAPRMGREAL